MDSKRIGTFKEWLKDQRQKKIIESNVSIECDWWDQCIVEVLQDLEEECNGNLTMDALTNYVKAKFSILGRTWDEYCDNIVLMHVKDLIFFHHGDSFSDACGDYDNTVLHSKGIVIEELAKVIYERVLQKTDSSLQDPTPTTRLVDKEPATLVPMKEVPNDMDDDGYDYVDEKKLDPGFQKIKGFEDFNLLKEAISSLKLKSYDECLRMTLSTLDDEAGSLDFEAVYNYLKVGNMALEDKTTMVLKHIYCIVWDCIQANPEMKLLSNANTDDPKEVADVIFQAQKFFCSQIVDDVMKAITKGNKEETANEKA